MTRTRIVLAIVAILGALLVPDGINAMQIIQPWPERVKALLSRSEKLNAVLREATAAAQKPIRFLPLPDDAVSQTRQGQTNYSESEITVELADGFPDEHLENLVVHELFHIILNAEGFPREHIDYVPANDKITADLIVLVGTEMVNCYLDEIIDRRMAKRGFRPELLNDAALTARTVTLIDARLAGFPLWQKYAALDLYCLSIRRRTVPLNGVEQWLRETSSEAFAQYQALTAAMANTTCDTPAECLRQQRELRARLQVSINGRLANDFIHPTTGSLE